MLWYHALEGCRLTAMPVKLLRKVRSLALLAFTKHRLPVKLLWIKTCVLFSLSNFREDSRSLFTTSIRILEIFSIRRVCLQYGGKLQFTVVGANVRFSIIFSVIPLIDVTSSELQKFWSGFRTQMVHTSQDIAVWWWTQFETIWCSGTCDKRNKDTQPTLLLSMATAHYRWKMRQFRLRSHPQNTPYTRDISEVTCHFRFQKIRTWLVVLVNVGETWSRMGWHFAFSAARAAAWCFTSRLLLFNTPALRNTDNMTARFIDSLNKQISSSAKKKVLRTSAYNKC